MKTKSAKKTSVVSLVERGILCGTDFSRAAGVAVDVATDFARRLGAPLTLAHALELPHALKSDLKAVRWLTASRKRSLHEVAEASRKRGVHVRESVRVGSADEVLVQTAAEKKAGLIVVSSLGDRRPGKWLLGSVAERTAGSTEIPTLVLRKGEPLRAWLRGQRPLKIFVCYNFSASAESALRWAKSLLALGPCEIVLGYANTPLDDYLRLGVGGRLPFAGNPPEMSAILERDLRERARACLGDRPVRCRVEEQLGGPAKRLADLAREEGADLIITGSRQYGRFQRLWDASVSRGLLGNSAMSVAIVPAAATQDGPGRLPALRHVLVSTDFSEMGNSAVPHAYSLVRGGGLVTLLHVIAARSRSAPRESEADFRKAEEAAARLRALIPEEAARLGVRTRIKVISRRPVGLAISQEAERLGVDVVCFASRDSFGLSKLLFGSVAEEVIARVRRPVLVVRPPSG